MSNRRIYFWEPELSPHKFPLVEAVHASPQFGGATYIAERPLNEKRVAQGWEANVPSSLDVYVAPDVNQVERIVAESAVDSVHVFSGLRRVPCIVGGIQAAIRHKRHFGVLQEPRVFEGASGWARLIQSWLTEQHIRTHAKFILAVGRHGPPWFRLAGYNPRKVFLFAYFLPPPANFVRVERKRPRVVFLGRLERLKGAHLFSHALDHIQTDIDVVIAGYGSLEDLVKRECEKDPSRRLYLGVLPMSETGPFLADADVLVLPSITKDDGWGAVVSEALMAGTAVVASDRVGASCSLDGKYGDVIEALTPRSIAQSIDRLLSNPLAISDHFREARKNWAQERLSNDYGAKYLHQIIEYTIESREKPDSFLS